MILVCCFEYGEPPAGLSTVSQCSVRTLPIRLLTTEQLLIHRLTETSEPAAAILERAGLSWPTGVGTGLLSMLIGSERRGGCQQVWLRLDTCRMVITQQAWACSSMDSMCGAGLNWAAAMSPQSMLRESSTPCWGPCLLAQASQGNPRPSKQPLRRTSLTACRPDIASGHDWQILDKARL